MDSFGEEGVCGGLEGRWRVECGPGFGNEYLGALPKEDWGGGMSVPRENKGIYGVEERLTSSAIEPGFVTE